MTSDNLIKINAKGSCFKEGEMKHKNFEDFLQDYHCKTHPTILDDDLPDAFDEWISGLDIDRWIYLGDKYLAEQLKEGQR